MININKTYIPANEKQIIIDFFCDDIVGLGFGAIEEIALYKTTNLITYKYLCTQSMDSSESFYNTGLDYGSLQLIIDESSIEKEFDANPEFTFDGITKIIVKIHEDDDIEALVYNRYEFFAYKSKLINLNVDFSNTSKLSKAINTIVFLERMLDYCIDRAQEEEANSYYRELVKVSNFWYSNLIQNNPNAIY